MKKVFPKGIKMKGFKSEENKNLFIQGMKDDNFTQEEIDAKDPTIITIVESQKNLFR